jgi:hypothetical protein
MGQKTTPLAVQANLPDIAKPARASRKGEQAVLLSRAVESEIIPRLVRAHVVA